MKRESSLNWDEYFMGICLLSRERSKDPNTQVGACIVNSENRILGIGYNGAPNGFSDEEFPWGREGVPYDTKYFYVVHAERNAILNFFGNKSDLKGTKLYVSHFPCNECAKEIVQVGISEVIYLCDKYPDSNETKAAKRIFDACGVSYCQLKSDQKIELSFDAKLL